MRLKFYYATFTQHYGRSQEYIRGRGEGIYHYFKLYLVKIEEGKFKNIILDLK